MSQLINGLSWLKRSDFQQLKLNIIELILFFALKKKIFNTHNIEGTWF